MVVDDISSNVARIGRDDVDRILRIARRLVDDFADDARVDMRQIEARLPALHAGAGCNNDDIGVARVSIISRTEMRGSPDRGGMREIEDPALGAARREVDQNNWDAGNAVGEKQSSRAANKTCANDRDFAL